MLSPEQIEQIKMLRDKGLKVSHIARELGVHRATIQKYLEEVDGMAGDIEGRPSRRNKGRPWVANPSPQLKNKRELCEGVDLELDIQQKLRELEQIKSADTSAVRQTKDMVEITELNIRGAKAQKELKTLQVEEKEQEKRNSRRALIEKIKANILPPSFKAELPPDICLEILNEVSLKLSELDMGMLSEEEVWTHAVVVRNRFFARPEVNEVVRFAWVRSRFKDADAELHRMWQEWREAKIQWVCNVFLKEEKVPEETARSVLVNNNCFSYEDFWLEFVSKAPLLYPQKYSEMIKYMVAFNYAIGNGQEMEELARHFQQVAARERGKFPLS